MDQLQCSAMVGYFDSGAIDNAIIKDYRCSVFELCPLCSLDKLILKIFVHGLCRKSLYEKFNDHL